MHKLPRRSSIVTLVVIAVAVGVILSCASDGKHVVPPATFEVTMDGNAFKFADGTRVLFDDQKLTGAGVFAELVFHKTDCPPE